MNIRKHQIALCSAIVALSLPLAAADNTTSPGASQSSGQHSQIGQSSQYGSSQSAMQSSQSSDNIRASKIIDADVTSRDGQDLGEVEDLVVDQSTGKINFIVLGKGGFLGIGEDRVPVPWRAVTVKSDGSLVVNQDKAKLQSAPKLNKDYSNLSQPGYTVTIYEFYAVPTSGMGGAESPGGMNQNQGSSTSSNDVNSASPPTPQNQ